MMVSKELLDKIMNSHIEVFYSIKLVSDFLKAFCNDCVKNYVSRSN